MDQESMTRFLTRFNYAKTQAITAGNHYTEDQVVDLFLAAANSINKAHYYPIVNTLAEKRMNGETLLFSDIETRFLKSDEKTSRRKQTTRHSANMSSHMDIGTPSTKLNKYPHRNKAKGFAKPMNKDNKQTRPPAKDQPKKYK